MSTLSLPLGLLVLAATTVPARAQCEVLTLTGPPVELYGGNFGFSVSLAGDRIAVGDSYGGEDRRGTVEVFENSSDGAWISSGILVASSGETYPEFGCSVAIDGDTLAVGAVAEGSLSAKGAAYLFERQSNGSWLETAKLVPPIAAGWAFGWAVDLEGDRLVVGAKGASDLSGGKGWAFVYEREDGAWEHKASLQPSISKGGDGFGHALDLDGERLLVGASYQWTFGEGYAFVFERDAGGTSWTETAAFSPDDITEYDLFGTSVALEGDRIVVGAPLHSLPSMFAGAAYVFDRIEGAWTQTGKLSPSALPYLTDFGWSVGIGEGHLLVGARYDSDVASAAGAVYCFEQTDGQWLETTKVYGSSGEKYDTFGWRMDVDASHALVGAPAKIGNSLSPGHAFLFDLGSTAPSLISSAVELSLSQGGAQPLQIGACGAHAGDLYALAGTTTGTAPGLSLLGLDVPLNADAYFLHTVLHPGAAPLSGGLGVLDAYGRADAAFSLPPGSPAELAGLVLHHAYVVIDLPSLQVQSVSTAAPLALVP